MVIPKKRGRPATGKDPLVALRLPPEMIEAVDVRATQQKVSRSEVIRSLIERGLTEGTSSGQKTTPHHTTARHVRGANVPKSSDTNARKLLRSVQRGLRAKGWKQRDRKALINVIEMIRPDLPEAYRNLSNNALRMAFYRALRSRPQNENLWLSLVRQWHGHATVEMTEDYLDDLLEIAGSTRSGRLGELFDHLERQWYWDGRRKLKEMQRYREGMKGDYWPRLRPMRSGRMDWGRAKINAFVRERIHSKDELRRKLRITDPAITRLMQRMIELGELVRVGEAMFGPPGSGTYAPASHRIMEILIPCGSAGMMRTPLVNKMKKIGHTANATDSATRTLRQNGILAPSTRGPVRLSSNTIAKIERGEPIRDNRGSIIWTSTGR